MRMKPIALVLTALVLVLSLAVGDYDRADSNLKAFYGQILAADFTGARRSIDEAIRLWPGNSRYYTWSAYCASQKLPPQCPRAFRGMDSAMSGADQQSARRAIEDYRHALRLNGRDAVAYHNLAWLEHLFGEDTAADKDWREATQVDPDNAVFHLSYGMFLEESGKAQAGKGQFEAAIELSPSIVDSPFFVRYRERYPEAANSIVTDCINKLESRLGRGRDPILEARLGKLYQYTQNWGRSMDLLQDAANKLPNLALVWFNLGEAYAQRGDTAQALDCYKKASFIDGSLARPYLRMGEIYLQNGQKDLARQNLSSAAAKWEHVNPITALHNNRLYNGPRQQIDDLLPTTLVWYTTPCEASRAWRGLSQLFPQKQEYAVRAQTCEQLPSPHSVGNLAGGSKP
jgi:tetratricopeptide (TPR) repeat protein